MIIREKDGNTIIIVVSLILSFTAVYLFYNHWKNEKKAEGVLVSADSRLELKELSDKLLQIIIEGSDLQQVDVVAKKIRSLAELVIVGKIIAVSSEGRENSGSINSNGYFTIEIESVKKGSYPLNQIKILFGMYSNEMPVVLYPPHLKTKYRSGDRVKLYLNYIPEFGCYVTVAGFYSIQPL
ncbi:MAG: hypothetical protein WC442_04660 [Candidatus Omnitrophota bacterium]